MELMRRGLSLVLAMALIASFLPGALYARAEETETEPAAIVEETTAPTEAVTEPVEETTAPTEAVTEPVEETTAPTEAETEPTEKTEEVVITGEAVQAQTSMTQAEFVAAVEAAVAAGEDYYFSGNLTLTDDLTLNANEVNSWIYIEDGASITVPSGKTLTLGCTVVPFAGGTINVEAGGSLVARNSGGLQLTGGVLNVAEGAALSGEIILYLNDTAAANGVDPSQIHACAFPKTAAELENALGIDAGYASLEVLIETDITLESSIEIPESALLNLLGWNGSVTLTIPNGVTVTNYGRILLGSGTTLVVEEGGTLVNNGDLDTENGTFTVNGSFVNNNTGSSGGNEFTTFEELKALAAETYDNYTVVFYTGTDVLEITESLTIPNNLAIDAFGAEIRVAEGVTFTASSLMTSSIVVDGTMNIGEGLTVYEALTVNGQLNINGWSLWLSSDAEVTGWDKITFGSYTQVYWEYTVTNIEELKAAVAAANNSENSRYFYWIGTYGENVEINESVTIPSNAQFIVGGGVVVTVAAGCTLTSNAWLDLNGTLAVNGTLVNNSNLNVYYDAGATLEIGSGGSYEGSGALYVRSDELSAVDAAVPGLDLSDFEVMEYNEYSHYFELRNVSGLTPLGAPTDLEWGYAHDGWVDGKAEAKPGYISWKAGQPDQAQAKIQVYREGEDIPCFTANWNFGSTEAGQWLSIDDFINDDPESGTYYFTVTSKGDYTQYRNSETVTSGTWTYTKPDARLGAGSSLTWNWPEMVWTAPVDTTYLDGYEIECWYAATADAEPYCVSMSWWRSGSDTSPENTMGDWVIQERGSGYYYYRVRALSSDITVVCNGEWSELSPAYNLTETTEKVESELENITTTEPDEIREAVNAIDNDELKTAMLADQSDTGTVAKVAELERTVGINTNISVTESAPAIEQSKVTIVGAGLNTLEDTGEDITLVISEPKSTDHVIPEAYDNTVAVSFSMDLENVANTEELEVPVKITLPVPENINPNFLVILHYHVDGQMEEIWPHIYQEGGRYYASFVLTGFSDFIMIQQKTYDPGDINGDGAVDDLDVAALLWHTLFDYSVKGEPDVNRDKSVNESDVTYLLWHILFPEIFPVKA